MLLINGTSEEKDFPCFTAENLLLSVTMVTEDHYNLLIDHFSTDAE